MSFRLSLKAIPKFLILSILFHGIAMIVSVWIKEINTASSSQSKKETVSIEIVDVDKSVADKLKKNRNLLKNKRIVDQDKINNEIDPKTDLLSSHNQRVLKETVAKNHGRFQNKKQQQERKERVDLQKSINPSAPLPKDLFGTYKSSLAKTLEKQQKNEFQQKQEGDETSRSRDYLPDKSEGLETLLSTREFVYYSYYTRIRNQLSEYWEPKIKQKVLKLFKQGRRLASTEDHITKLQIVLDAKGLLVKVQILGASGVQDLDEVAIEAFRAAAPFPNPPKGIIESDGTVKIEWDFVVET